MLVGCAFESGDAGADTDSGSSTSESQSTGVGEATSEGGTTADSDSNTGGDSSGGGEDVCAPQGVPAQWTEGELISPCGRANPLGLPDAQVSAYAQAGHGHALHYPV